MVFSFKFSEISAAKVLSEQSVHAFVFTSGIFEFNKQHINAVCPAFMIMQ